MTFKEEMKARSEAISRDITAYLPKEEGFQKTIFEACNYSVINGGKRLRPMMMQAVYELCRGGAGSFGEEDHKILMPFMAAMEMICFSASAERMRCTVVTGMICCLVEVVMTP